MGLQFFPSGTTTCSQTTFWYQTGETTGTSYLLVAYNFQGLASNQLEACVTWGAKNSAQSWTGTNQGVVVYDTCGLLSCGNTPANQAACISNAACGWCAASSTCGIVSNPSSSTPTPLGGTCSGTIVTSANQQSVPTPSPAAVSPIASTGFNFILNAPSGSGSCTLPTNPSMSGICPWSASFLGVTQSGTTDPATCAYLSCTGIATCSCAGPIAGIAIGALVGLIVILALLMRYKCIPVPACCARCCGGGSVKAQPIASYKSAPVAAPVVSTVGRSQLQLQLHRAQLSPAASALRVSSRGISKVPAYPPGVPRLGGSGRSVNRL